MIPAVFSKRSLAHEYADKVRKTQRGYWHGKPDQLPFEAIVIEVQLPD